MDELKPGQQHEQLIIQDPVVIAEMGRAVIISSEKHIQWKPKGGDNEWYTPPNVVEAARQTMGAIDLDPASCPIAQEVVKATTYYSENDNGLNKVWRGRVFMNPPYGGKIPDINGRLKGIKHAFMHKLGMHYEKGDITEACVVTPTDFSASWGNAIRTYAVAMCHEIRYAGLKWNFWKPDRDGNENGGAPSMLSYYGPNPDRFAEACWAHNVGFVTMAYRK